MRWGIFGIASSALGAKPGQVQPVILHAHVFLGLYRENSEVCGHTCHRFSICLVSVTKASILLGRATFGSCSKGWDDGVLSSRQKATPWRRWPNALIVWNYQTFSHYRIISRPVWWPSLLLLCSVLCCAVLLGKSAFAFQQNGDPLSEDFSLENNISPYWHSQTWPRTIYHS